MDIIELSNEHLEGALELSAEANWNQVADDWQMMMTQGQAIGIVESGTLVASALTLPYGDDFGWISMVLVTKSHQKRGIATRLLNECIERLEREGRTPVLDATPAGENVYRPLGFLPHFVFQRWEHPAAEEISSSSTNAAEINETDVLSYDQSVFGGKRPHVLKSLIKRSQTFACGANEGHGYLLGRDGRVATQIGPVFSETLDNALNMLDQALANLTGPVFIDACDHQTEFIERLRSYGFEIQRPFLRMAKGRSQDFGQRDQMFAMAGPELG